MRSAKVRAITSVGNGTIIVKGLGWIGLRPRHARVRLALPQRPPLGSAFGDADAVSSTGARCHEVPPDAALWPCEPRLSWSPPTNGWYSRRLPSHCTPRESHFAPRPPP